MMLDGRAGAVTDGPVRARLTRSNVAGIVGGNVLEFYDFTVFAFFAPQIGKAMFASGRGSDGLLLALATYAVGFLARPVGAAVIGRYADTAGRRPAMVLSFALMGGSLLVTALTPPSSWLGPWSAVVIALARLVQGFALGGEVGPAMSLLIEAAPAGRRGAWGSWQMASQGIAILLGGLVGLAVSLLLGPRAVADWGWRIAFLIGAAVLPVGIVLRRRVPETLAHPGRAESLAEEVPPILPLLMSMGLLLILSGTITAYTLQYISTFCVSVLKLSPVLAFTATVATGTAMFAFALIGGVLSDRYGRRAVIVLPRIVLAAITYPIFAHIVAHPALGSLAGGVFAVTALFGMSTAAANVALAEGIPPARRSTAYALIYTLAVSIFGGSAQFLIAWMNKVTADPMVPAWWLIAATLTGIAAGLFMPVRRAGA